MRTKHWLPPIVEWRLVASGASCVLNIDWCAASSGTREKPWDMLTRYRVKACNPHISMPFDQFGRYGAEIGM